jgi:tetratricopeptide (TPR) repeat protein
VAVLGCLAATLGSVLCQRQAGGAEPPHELTSAQRQQMAEEARALNGQAVELHEQGKYAESTRLLERALALRRQLYPRGQYPHGHPDLASSLSNLGFVLQAQGEYAKAEPHYRDALALRRQLYPKDQYPQGHPDLAGSLNNLAALLRARGEF